MTIGSALTSNNDGIRMCYQHILHAEDYKAYAVGPCGQSQQTHRACGLCGTSDVRTMPENRSVNPQEPRNSGTSGASSLLRNDPLTAVEEGHGLATLVLTSQEYAGVFA